MSFQFVCEMKGNTAQCTLSQVNIYQKPDTRKSLFATPPLYLPHLLLMFGQKQTELEPMQGESIQRASIYWAARSVFGSFHCSIRWCHCVLSCRIHRPLDMARLALPVFLLLCFSLLHLSSSRPSRTRKAVSARQPGGNDTQHHIDFNRTVLCSCVYLTGVFFLPPRRRDAAAEEDDVKSQLERLWQEVNSLKEMQALQTGTAHYTKSD